MNSRRRSGSFQSQPHGWTHPAYTRYQEPLNNILMNSKVHTLRALTHIVAQRSLKTAAVILAVSLLATLAITWVLAYFLSAWWWLLLLVIIPLALIGSLLLLFALFLAIQIYPYQLLPAQKQLLDDFVDKIQKLIESAGMSWQWFTLLCVKDLILYRDMRTLKEYATDSAGLKRDFAELEAAIQPGSPPTKPR